MGVETRAARPGDACSVTTCDGRMKVYKTMLNFVRKVRIRYLHCPKCGAIPELNKWVLPLEFAPARTTSSPDDVCSNDYRR